MPTPAGRRSESGEAAPIEEIGSRPNRAAYSQIAIVRQFAEVRFAPKTGKWRTPVAGPRSAMCGRLRVGKENLHVRRGWSVQPCVRPVSAVRMTAGHNALRGSGPGQNLAFDHALALVGCPD